MLSANYSIKKQTNDLNNTVWRGFSHFMMNRMWSLNTLLLTFMILLWEANFIVNVSLSVLWLKTMYTDFLVSKFVFMTILQQQAQKKVFQSCITLFKFNFLHVMKGDLTWLVVKLNKLVSLKISVKLFRAKSVRSWCNTLSREREWSGMSQSQEN